MLQQAFDASTKLYQERGFQRRVGFGKRPALISVDLANAWTRPGNPFTCDQDAMDNEIIPGMQRLLKACRANGHPVIHVTTAYEITDRNAAFTDMGLWHCKIPIDVVDLKNKELWAIDSRIAPVEGEYTLLKKRASAFHGTGLGGLLRAAGVDTILVTALPRPPACAPRYAMVSPTGSGPSRRVSASATVCRARLPGTSTTSMRSSPMSTASMNASTRDR
jgi:N-carbamoylsarcosine amidase